MRLAFVLTVALALATMAFAADIAGTWKGTLETPMGPMENTIVLQADGASVTGSVKTDMFEAKVERQVGWRQGLVRDQYRVREAGV